MDSHLDSGTLAAWNGAAYHHLLCGLFAGNGIHFRLSSHAVSSCTALFGTAIARASRTRPGRDHWWPHAGVFVVLALGTSLSLAVLRSEFGPGMLRFALAPIGILALTMATATVATAIWTIRLWIDAPQFAASASGLGNGQTAWVIAMIAAMSISTVITVGAFTSGLRASLVRAS